MPALRCSFRIDLALALIAVVASAGLSAGVAGAQVTTDPRSDVIVDLSVIGDDGFGPSSDPGRRRSGLAMPGSKTPVSRMYTPMPVPAPAPTLTPPPPRSRMTLIPPRPETQVVTTPRSLTIEVARVPRPVTAPSRTGALVAPMSTPTEPPGTPAALPPPLPQWTQPAGAPKVSTPIAEPAVPETSTSQPARSKPLETTSMSSTATAALEPNSAKASPPSAPTVAETPPVEPAAEKLPPPPPMATTMEAPLPEPTGKAPPPPSAAKTEQALLPPEGAPGAPERTLQIPFAAGETTLAKSAQEKLEGLAENLRSAENLRVQLLAYAADEGASPSKARRVSLSRALAVRSYLIESGIKTSRIDVRALGDKSTSGLPDRVDVEVVER
jgi:outer membrane protein OmpA-like peptidoglycan-associated protein